MRSRSTASFRAIRNQKPPIAKQTPESRLNAYIDQHCIGTRSLSAGISLPAAGPRRQNCASPGA